MRLKMHFITPEMQRMFVVLWFGGGREGGITSIPECIHKDMVRVRNIWFRYDMLITEVRSSL